MLVWISTSFDQRLWIRPKYYDHPWRTFSKGLEKIMSHMQERIKFTHSIYFTTVLTVFFNCKAVVKNRHQCSGTSHTDQSLNKAQNTFFRTTAVSHIGHMDGRYSRFHCRYSITSCLTILIFLSPLDGASCTFRACSSSQGHRLQARPRSRPRGESADGPHQASRLWSQFSKIK